MRQRMGIRSVLVLMGVVVIVAALPIAGFCEVPQKIGYQGKLTDDLGNPLDGDYMMVFSIYDAPSGGTVLWGEAQTVTVANGIFNVQIGQDPIGNPFPANLLDGSRWLGVTVGEDDEMTPRQPLTSVPYALQAGSIPAGAVTSVMLADEAVTAEKVAVAAITADKIVGGTGSGVDADQLDGHDTTYFASAATVTALESQVAALQNQVNTLVTLLANVTRNGNNITFTGVNVRIVNGTGTTDGTTNGLGNLIVGYNEIRGGDNRTGSHNIVVGMQNDYSSYGGMVVGRFNTISGMFSSVTAGDNNTASGVFSSVSGGQFNESFSNYSAVLGGQLNRAGDNSNPNNHGVGEYATVSGGYSNHANGAASSVVAGYNNTASGSISSVSGGSMNLASGEYSSVSGGSYNKASGDYSFVGGGGGDSSTWSNEAFSHYSAILGGRLNIAGNNSDPNDHSLGQQATISGGSGNSTTGQCASVSGGAGNQSSGYMASISGGEANKASGDYSFVGGGGGPNAYEGNLAFADYSSILGGSKNGTGELSIIGSIPGYEELVPGTDHNVGIQSTVSGGYLNIAYGNWSSVSGGSHHAVIGDYDWRAGDDFFSDD